MRSGFVYHYRRPLKAIANAIIIGAAYTLAFLMRFDFTIPEPYFEAYIITLPIAIALQYAAFYVFKITDSSWRYVGIADFVAAAKASVAGQTALAASVLLFHRALTYPRSILLLHGILVLGMTIGARLVVRLWRRVPVTQERNGRKRLLVIGAGDTGDALVREIKQSPRLQYQVVAFLDDDRSKHKAYINGVPVIDGVAATPEVVKRFRIDEIIAATPSASGEEMRIIVERCRAAEIPFKVMPATWEILGGHAGIGAAREVNLTDLLRRPPIKLDLIGIGRFIKGKRVVVTGAAGSIGSEICRQILGYQPALLVCLDHDENALFQLERSLGTSNSATDIRYALVDITDEPRVKALFADTRPHVVYHAAAHKHVPVVEANPSEGVRNNTFGAELVARVAGEHGAEAFVLISTDKAVNPTSIMGASKRAAEKLIQTLPYKTRYAAVRFGNVLGSQGSVVPIWKEQIASGAPVTVTHPEMRRYFMTIPEAVQLVIQASAMGKGDEVFILDMGEPVKIVDLAKDLIRLSGLQVGPDIAIEFSGVRPGEKLSEELCFDPEAADRTTHPKILVAKHASFDKVRFASLIEDLRRAVFDCDEQTVRRLIPKLVPEFRGVIDQTAKAPRVLAASAVAVPTEA